MNLNLKDLKSIKKKQEIIAKDKKIKINSFLNITSTPVSRPHVYLQYKNLENNNNKIMKDNQTNTDLFSFKNHFLNKRRISSGNNFIDIILIKNIKHPHSSNISASSFKNKKNNIDDNNDIEINSNIIKSIIFKNNNSNDILNKNKQNSNRLKKIKDKIMIDSNFSLKKRFKSTYKKNNNIMKIDNNNSLYNCQNKINKNDIKSFDIINNKMNKRKNMTDIYNNMNSNNIGCTKNTVKKKANTFFNNKILQEKTDISQIGKIFKNNKNVTIKFSLPKNYETKNIIVDNNISLENTFKEQTVSNFNNKYNFKFKTNNLKEKEKIKKLFCLLKKHKNSDIDKNSDFFAFHFHLNRQKKFKNKEMTEPIFSDCSNLYSYIGRNKKESFLSNDYYTDKNDFDFENSLMQIQKENKALKIKSLKKDI